mmetsp:Transcript_10658/g.25736  ORF Transcript_10658/g.25736 Transcript_10658/m.25736 type:complete len:495 (-) Transcript_10658:99-1583(-)
MNASSGASSSSSSRRRRRRRRNEFRFQLIRCYDPNRAVSRILDLKNNHQDGLIIVNNTNNTNTNTNTNATLFQIQDVLDNNNNAVLTALLEIFQYFAKEGIQWQTLDIQETRNKMRYDVAMLHELLRLANESSLFREIRLTIRSRHNMALEPDANDGPFLQSIERNSRLVTLKIDWNAGPSGEDIQSLIRLLRVSKTLKHLDLKWHALNIADFSDGFTDNSTLKSLSLTAPPEGFSRTCSVHDMMTVLSRYPAMRLQKLTLSSKGDGDLSSALESLLLSQQGLRMINVYCNGGASAEGFSMQGFSPGRPNPFDSFFRRLSNLAPPHIAAATATSSTAMSTTEDHHHDDDDDEQQQQREQQQREQSLDRHLIENGPLITIGTNMYRATKDQLAFVKQALIHYPKLRLASSSGETAAEARQQQQHHPPAEIDYTNLLNHCGRYLMNNDCSNVPLGLWPIALERAACMESHKRQRSSALYELLHGGVFAARETYASI